MVSAQPARKKIDAHRVDPPNIERPSQSSASLEVNLEDAELSLDLIITVEEHAREKEHLPINRERCRPPSHRHADVSSKYSANAVMRYTPVQPKSIARRALRERAILGSESQLWNGTIHTRKTVGKNPAAHHSVGVLGRRFDLEAGIVD